MCTCFNQALHLGAGKLSYKTPKGGVPAWVDGNVTSIKVGTSAGLIACPDTAAAPNQACSAYIEQLVLWPSAGGQITRSVSFGQHTLETQQFCHRASLCLMPCHLGSVPHAILLKQWASAGGACIRGVLVGRHPVSHSTLCGAALSAPHHICLLQGT